MVGVTKLFRQEALDHKRDTWLGDILLVRPIGFAWLTLFFFLLAAGSLAYLVWGEYTKKVRVTGYLVPDQGLIKLYAQISGPIVQLKVKEGQTVSQGQTIGSMGSTGFSTGPHLHFEIRPNGGSAIDPMTFLASAKR